MISAAKVLADLFERERRQLPCQVHADLAWQQDLSKSVFRLQQSGLQVKVPADAFDDPFDRRTVGVGLDAELFLDPGKVELPMMFGQRSQLLDGSLELPASAGEVLGEPLEDVRCNGQLQALGRFFEEDQSAGSLPRMEADH